MVITIPGETPSKKNSRVFNTKTKRSFPNKRYAEWHESAVMQIRAQNPKPVPEGVRVCVTMTFYHGDMKRRDSDNQCSSVLDMLTDAGVIPDDSWKVIPVKHIYDAYDKGNARCVVCVEEI